MAWFALARVLFVAAVAYAAAVLRPLPVNAGINVAFALGLAVLVVLFESRLRETAVTRILGALIGCAIGLALARTIASGLFWTDSGDRRVSSSSTASCSSCCRIWAWCSGASTANGSSRRG